MRVRVRADVLDCVRVFEARATRDGFPYDIWAECEADKAAAYILELDYEVQCVFVFAADDLGNLNVQALAARGGERVDGEAYRVGDYVGHIVAYGEDKARQLGLRNVRLLGRHGWGKVLAEYGYGRSYSYLEKEIV